MVSPRKLFTSLIAVTILAPYSNKVKADWDYWAIKVNSDSSKGYDFYTVVNETGEATLRNTKCWEMPNYGGQCETGLSNDIYVDPSSGDLWFENSNQDMYSYNLETNTWTAQNDDWRGNYTIIRERSSINASSDGTINIGHGDDILLKKKTNGEYHLGKNSFVTKEENGMQNIWGQNANGKKIPLNVKGSKLLINGRDVEQSINNVGALSAALTGLPTVPTDTTLACGLGTGTHGGDFAFSGGCASQVNEKLSINYAASMTIPGQDYAGDFEDQFSARAGFVWKLGKSIKPTQISMKAKEKMEAKIFSLEKSNKKIISQNEDLKQKNQSIISQNKSLLARLERLEKVALGKSKSQDLATIKLP